MTSDLASFVGGEWIAGPNVFDDIDPTHPSEVLATVRGADEAIVDDAVATARRAQHAWARTPAPARADTLFRIAQLLNDMAPEVGRDMAREEGKTLAEAIIEVRFGAAQFRYAAGRAFEPDGATVSPRDARTAALWSRREPLGVVACITPWNFPIAIPAWKIAHALGAGNAVVWKPAEITPLSATHLARCCMEAGLPAGVLNMVLGDGVSVGRHLVRSELIDAISFTGSSAVGRKIHADVTRPQVRIQLEMGGSNPAVVLEDADLDLAADEIASGAFHGSGQRCTATARVIVAKEIFDDLADRLAHRARTFTVGDPLDEGTVLGPVASANQYAMVRDALRAVDGDAALVGGAPPERADGDGYFISPTIYAGIPEDHRVATQEVFGPVTTLLRSTSYNESVRLANGSPYGLSASIFTCDLDRALRFAHDAEVGAVRVNKATTGSELHVPFGGVKESGAGAAEMGWGAAEFYTKWKTVYLAHSTHDVA